MKSHILILLSSLILISCKKDKKTEVDYINHSERIKTARISYFYNGNVNTKSVFTYHYDGFNRLNHVSIADSTFVGGQWLTRSDDSLATYKYNALNKVVQMLQPSQKYELDYLYDSNQFLAMSLSKFEDGRIDTTFYSKVGNIIMSNRHNYNGFEKSFYVTNIDSVINYDSTNFLYQRSINTLSSKANLAYTYINQFFSYTNQNEIIGTIRIRYENGSSKLETTTYSYTYDNQSYPLTLTSKVDGVINVIYNYTYY